MGGSKSSQTQQTSNTSIQQSFTDQSYNDYSDNSRVDIWTDNSDNSRVDIWTDNSNNSRNEGILSGSTVGGSVQIFQTADGAFDVVGAMAGYMRDVSETAVKQATEQTYLATQAATAATANALSSNERISTRALDNMSLTASDSIAGMLSTSRYAIDGMLDSTMVTADTIRKAAADSAQQTASATQAAIQSSNQAMERNAALIQTTALGGQDLVIDMAKKIGIAAVAAIGLGTVAFAVRAK